MKQVVMLVMVFAASAAHAETRRSVKAAYDARAIGQTLEQIQRDIGRVPTKEEWPLILTEGTGISGWKGPYLDRVPKDPWGQDYFYSASPLGVYSAGVNGVNENGHSDDISSWAGYDHDIYYPNWRRDLALWWLVVGGTVGGLVAAVIAFYRLVLRRRRLRHGA